MTFEWDDRKNQTNLLKHGVSFEFAIQIFDDATLQVPSPRRGEPRMKALGQVEGIVLCVVFLPRGDSHRIISARRASRRERHLYHQALHP